MAFRVIPPQALNRLSLNAGEHAAIVSNRTTNVSVAGAPRCQLLERGESLAFTVNQQDDIPASEAVQFVWDPATKRQRRTALGSMSTGFDPAPQALYVPTAPTNAPAPAPAPVPSPQLIATPRRAFRNTTFDFSEDLGDDLDPDYAVHNYDIRESGYYQDGNVRHHFFAHADGAALGARLTEARNRAQACHAAYEEGDHVMVESEQQGGDGSGRGKA